MKIYTSDGRKLSERDGVVSFHESVSKEFVQGLNEQAKQAAHGAGKAARSWLRANAPKRTGDYRKDVRFRTQANEVDGYFGSVVYYDKMWPLTHLLEDGHEAYNQYGGPFGNVDPAKPEGHIAKAAEIGKAELERIMGVKL